MHFQNIIFGYNHSTLWQKQRKSPYRCPGYLQLPRSFGVRKKNPAANEFKDRIRRTNAHRNANRQSRLRIQDFHKILQKGVKARLFHTFFYRSPLCYHRHLFIALLSQRRISEKNREKQRNLEKFRDGLSKIDSLSGFVM